MKLKLLFIFRLNRCKQWRILLTIVVCTFLGFDPILTFAQQSDDVEAQTIQAEMNYFDDGKLFSEDQVIESALMHNKNLRFLETNSILADHRLDSGGWSENPELRLSDISTRYYATAINELRVGLRFRVPQLGQMGEEKQQLRVEFWENKVDEIRYRHEFIASVRKEYANVLMYDQLAELNQQRAARADERIHVIERLVDLGNRSVVYLTKAKLWQAESRNDLARALQNQRLARRELAKRTNIPTDALLSLEELPNVTQDLDELMKVGLANRPELELVRQHIELARQQRKYRYFRLIPWFNFVDVSYHIENTPYDDWTEFRAGINLPILNWNIDNIKATRLAVESSKNELDAIKETIEEEIRSAYLIYQDLQVDYATFKASAEELISQTETLTDQAKTHNTLMPDEVLELQWTILDTKKLLAEKRQELAHALFDLYIALGIENHAQLFE